jgi:VWFA-related protein
MSVVDRCLLTCPNLGRVMNKHLAPILFTLISAIATLAQTPTPTPKIDDDIIKVSSRLIVVPVSVTDSTGQAVTGLTAVDFRISEEGKAQTIENVGTADTVPLEIALLFDVSASTDTMFKFQLETAAKFLKDVLRPVDRATVFTVGSRPILVSPRNTSEVSRSAIMTIEPTKGFTAFYDSVRIASEYLAKNAPEGTRRVMLVISDGEDTNSDRIATAIQDGYRKIDVNKLDRKALNQLTVTNRNTAAVQERVRVLRSLQNADTVFYSINPAGSSFQLNKMSMFGQENMQSFANDTGGSAFLPKFQPIDTKDTYQNGINARANSAALERIFRQIGNELRSQYLIQYYSEAEFPENKFVRVQVTTPNRPTSVRARQGYYVKN